MQQPCPCEPARRVQGKNKFLNLCVCARKVSKGLAFLRLSTVSLFRRHWSKWWSTKLPGRTRLLKNLAVNNSLLQGSLSMPTKRSVVAPVGVHDADGLPPQPSQ